jgi:hypothetical protein
MVGLLFDGEPFDRRRAAEGGLGSERIRELLRTAAIRHVLHGVYLDARVPDDLDSRGRCLSMRLPDGAAVCRRTAAWIYGVDGRMPDELTRVPPVECVVPVGREPVGRPGVRSYVAPMHPGDVQEVGGVPCTTPVRTAVDLLRWLPPHMGLAIADALAGRGLLETDVLTIELERWAGCHGVVQARRLAGLIEPGTESFGESWLRLRIVDAGFPRPVVQIEIVDEHGCVRYRLDLGWPDRCVAVEYDGEEFHSSPRDRRHDEARRNELLRLGWSVLAVGKGEVFGASMALERAVGELLSQAPTIGRRRW